MWLCSLVEGKARWFTNRLFCAACRMSSTQHVLARMWAPAVAVHASPEAQELCTAANGLTLAELLRPFGELAQLNGTQGGAWQAAGSMRKTVAWTGLGRWLRLLRRCCCRL